MKSIIKKHWTLLAVIGVFIGLLLVFVWLPINSLIGNVNITMEEQDRIIKRSQLSAIVITVIGISVSLVMLFQNARKSKKRK